MASSARRGLLLGPPPTPEERKQAIEDPGPSWREWFYFSFLKVWIPLGFLILDTILAAGWVESHNWIGLGVTLAVALYLEFLAFLYLWARLPLEQDRTQPFRPSWFRPVRMGRWTPERWYPERYRGARVVTGPDPDEFL